MTDFKFAKECSEKGIEFNGCQIYVYKITPLFGGKSFKKIMTLDEAERQCHRSFEVKELYSSPSEEELSKRLPNVIEKLNERINKKEFIEVMKWDFVIEEYTYRFQFEYNNNVIREKVSGKTKKECYQKAIILLNDMELLK